MLGRAELSGVLAGALGYRGVNLITLWEHSILMRLPIRVHVHLEWDPQIIRALA